jgi:diguanylate cyclase (GGDEF)-like protein
MTGPLFRNIRIFAQIPRDNPELLIAQFKIFSYQVPLLYLILTINTWALAATHFSSAPYWLTVVIPAVMSLVCGTRAVMWVRSIGRAPDAELAYRALRRTNRLASGIATLFTAWALLLFPYGDAYAKVHVAFYMAITVIGVIFCLLHLRSAAIAVAIIVNGAFVIFFLLSGNAVFIAIAINTALVCVAMLIVLLVQYRDFTRMVAAQTDNLRLANCDSLTGLPNRRAFFSALDQALMTAKAHTRLLAVGILDLDGFKPVNDLHGHPVGDKLLADVGRRLSEIVSGDMRLSRLGGDEFALLIPDLSDDAEAISIGQRMCEALRMPFQIGDVKVQIAGTAGFAIYPAMATTATDLFEFADYALYYAKRNRRSSAVLFSAAHKAAILSDATVEQALHLADLTKELAVVYQPIVRIDSRYPVGFEALARWTSPTLGCIPPATFIPVAERAGIIGRVTQTLLEKALKEASRWPEELRLSFNLSADDLTTDGGIASIVDIVSRSGFDPDRIDFEITETAFIQEFAFDRVHEAVITLREMGCGVSLDDFGTGYSSLSYLHALPLTKIKIDRSFVTNIHQNPSSYKIVKSLFALSRDMGLDCIVEGVETQDEMAAVRILGDAMVQGYLFAKPMPASQINAFLDGLPSAAPHH